MPNWGLWMGTRRYFYSPKLHGTFYIYVNVYSFFFWAEYLLSTFLTQIWDAPLLPQTKGENIHFKGRLRFSFALTHCSLRPMKEEFYTVVVS